MVHLFGYGMKISNYPIVDHRDGKWHTSVHIVMGLRCEIKMMDHKGCKIHIFDLSGKKVIKTFRYNFSTEGYLLNKASEWIKQINK